MIEAAVMRTAAARTAAFINYLGIVMTAGLGLAGCAPLGHVSPDLPVRQVTIAPGIVFALPPPALLNRSVQASQLVTARYQQRTFTFETDISVTPERLLAAGIDMFGRRAMTIEWRGGDLKAETAAWVPAELHAANVIADVMLTHWPANAVRAGLGPGCELRETGSGQRTISAGGRDAIRIDRVSGAPGSWSGRWTYRNLLWGYELDIQSSEAGP